MPCFDTCAMVKRPAYCSCVDYHLDVCFALVLLFAPFVALDLVLFEHYYYHPTGADP